MKFLFLYNFVLT